MRDKDEDQYFIDQLLDQLEKFGLKSAKPQTIDEAFRRLINRPVSIDNYLEKIDKILK